MIKQRAYGSKGTLRSPLCNSNVFFNLFFFFFFFTPSKILYNLLSNLGGKGFMKMNSEAVFTRSLATGHVVNGG